MFDLTAALFPQGATPKLRALPSAPLQQSALYARAALMLGAPTRFATLPGMAAWVVERQVPLLGTVGLISRPVMAPSARAAGRFRKALDVRHLIITAEDADAACALRHAGFWPLARARWIAELPLLPSSDRMAARLSGKWRNRLRQGLRGSATVTRRPCAPSTQHWLLKADAEQARRRGFAPLDPRMVSALAAAAPGAGQLFEARVGPRMVGAMLFLRHGAVASYQIGWINAEGRRHAAGQLLMWRAMVELQAMGVDRLDLGAADPQSAAGLAHFKRGTGAVLRPLGGTWLDSAILPRRPCAAAVRQTRAITRVCPPAPATGAPVLAAPPGPPAP